MSYTLGGRGGGGGVCKVQISWACLQVTNSRDLEKLI